MKYLSVKSNAEFLFKDDEINKILPEDIQLSDVNYNKFIELQSQGKQFRIKNKNGTTFEEIFEEYIPPVVPPQPTEIEMLQSAVDFMLTNY